MGLATIEDTFERMAKALERMADASEATQKAVQNAAMRPSAPNSPPPETPSAPASDAIPQAASAAASPATAISYETINKAVLSYSDKFGQAAAIALLAKYGAKIIKDLKADPSKYAEILEATKAGP
jgi:hypothetical protein